MAGFGRRQMVSPNSQRLTCKLGHSFIVTQDRSPETLVFTVMAGPGYHTDIVFIKALDIYMSDVMPRYIQDEYDGIIELWMELHRECGLGEPVTTD